MGIFDDIGAPNVHASHNMSSALRNWHLDFGCHRMPSYHFRWLYSDHVTSLAMVREKTSTALRICRRTELIISKSYTRREVSVIVPIFHRRMTTICLYPTSNRPGRMYK